MFSARQTKAMGKALMDVDSRAQELSERHANAPPVQALDWFSKLGDQPQLRAIAAVMIAGGVFGANERLTFAAARMMIAHEAATLAKDLLKRRIDRARPRSAQKGPDRKPRKGEHQSKEMTSFPSGHGAGAAAAARAFSREYPEYGVAAVAAAGLIAAAQVPRRAHYPTDVVAGFAIGLLSEAVVDFAWRAARLGRSEE